MKYLYLLAIVALLGACGSDSTDTIGNSTVTIGNSTVTIGNLEVMTKNLGLMNWEDAKKACADLGDGWRLPTKDELNILYHNKDKIGGFTLVNYWSSKVGDLSTSWIQNFDKGSQVGNLNSDTNSVRAVRSI
mgnify:CR=1 FL=1